MDLPKEIRYRAYSDWSTEKELLLQKMSTSHLGMSLITLSQKQAY